VAALMLCGCVGARKSLLSGSFFYVGEEVFLKW
jgi:hypothetical protein